MAKKKCSKLTIDQLKIQHAADAISIAMRHGMSARSVEGQEGGELMPGIRGVGLKRARARERSEAKEQKTTPEWADPGSLALPTNDLKPSQADWGILDKLQDAGYDEFALVVRKRSNKDKDGGRLVCYSFFTPVGGARGVDNRRPSLLPHDLRRVADWIVSETRRLGGK